MIARYAVFVFVGVLLTASGCEAGERRDARSSNVSRTDDSVLVLAAVGDIMMGSTFPEGAPLPPSDGDSLFLDVRDILRAADITFGNLEGPLIDGGRSEKCADNEPNCYAFRTPVRYVRHLVDAGFDLLSIANNHALDFGEAGRTSTIRALDSAGIGWSGPPGSIRYHTAGTRRIALVAFSYDEDSNNLRDLDAARALLRRAVDSSDIVIVSFHGGAEGAKHQHVPYGEETAFGEKRGSLRLFTHAMVDAGADIVIGHGPHVVRGMEVYKDRLIAYSLGNFATWAMFNLNGPNGISCILEARLALDGAFRGGRLHAVRQPKPGGAQRDSSKAVLPLLRELNRSDFPETGVSVDDDGVIRPPYDASRGTR